MGGVRWSLHSMRNSSLVSAFFAFATIGCGEAWRSGGGRSAAELADKLEMNERIPRQVAEALRRVDRAKVSEAGALVAPVATF